jgi:peptidoglycan/xylan/chitin deacetylase (PgdA/CDA1 family)
MKRRLKTLARNPLVITLPFLALLITGWLIYMHGLNAPSHAQHNLLATSTNGALPRGWKVQATTRYKTTRTKGYGGGGAFGFTLGAHQQGSVLVYSNTATVQGGQVYLYKAYHQGTTAFSLLVKYYYQNGDSSTQLVKQYGAAQKWTTNSYAFRTDPAVTGIQMIYDFPNTGSVWLDRPYLDQRSQGVYVAPAILVGKNLLSNGDLHDATSGMPTGWESRQAGNNDASFSYTSKDGQAYVSAQISHVKSGDAIWASAPAKVNFGQNMQISASYRSTAPAQLEAIYDLDNNTEISVPVANMPSTTEWATVHATTEVPSHAVGVQVGGALASAGNLDIGNFQLNDITKPGPRHFRRPLVSVVFGDGWSSTYLTASGIMNFLDYKGTFFVNPGSISQGPYLRWSEIRQLLQNSNQLGVASYEQVDLTTLNSGQLDRQLRLASGYVKSNWSQDESDFLPPYDRSDAEVEAMARKYFRSSISGGEGINTKQNFDAYNLKAVHIDKNTSVKHLSEMLQEAKNDNAWIILVYDRVQDNVTSTSAVPSRAFANQMQEVYDSRMPVVTIGNALEEEWGE